MALSYLDAAQIRLYKGSTMRKTLLIVLALALMLALSGACLMTFLMVKIQEM